MDTKDSDRPRYFQDGEWLPINPTVHVARRDVEQPCALCGWGRHMAIHDVPAGEKGPVGALGLHKWRGK